MFMVVIIIYLLPVVFVIGYYFGFSFGGLSLG